MLFLLLINVKMPIIVGILIFMSRKKIMLIRVEQEKNCYKLRPSFILNMHTACFLKIQLAVLSKQRTSKCKLTFLNYCAFFSMRVPEEN